MHPPSRGRRLCDIIMSRKTLRKIKAATYNNDHEKLKKLLANRSSRFCAQAMLFALRKGAKDISKIKRESKIVNKEVAIAAVKIENEELVKLFLDFGANVNATIAENPFWTNSLFNIACDLASVEIVRMMIDRGADLEMMAHSEYMPIQSAFESGDMDKITLFLDLGVDAAEIDRLQLLNFLVAHQTTTRDVVERLLQLCADVNGCEEQETSVLASACRGTFEVFKLLVDNGADVTKIEEDGETLLECAVRNKNFEIVEYLLKLGADVHRGNVYPLKIAAEQGNREILELLLRHGANINHMGDLKGNPIDGAAAKGHVKIVELMLERGAEPRVLILHQAILRGQSGVVKLLLDRGFDPNSAQRGRKALCSAVQFGREGIVKLLLDHGAKVDETSEIGLNPLHYSAFDDRCQIAKLLLDQGADINIETSTSKHNALTMALKLKRFQLAKLLVKHAVLLKSKGSYVSPLILNAARAYPSICAFQEECVKEVELLMKRKFDDSDLCYFDILKIEKNIDKLAAVISNETIVKTFKSDNYLNDFAIYGEDVRRCFGIGFLRNSDFEFVKRLFNYLSTRDHDQLPKLPFTVVCEIFTYLDCGDVDELRNL